MTDWHEIPRSKYRCQKCEFYFENERPGPTICPKCGHNYVDWLNHIEVLKALGRWIK
jgi:rRNA maturation endonuclease Nob1